MCNINWTAVGAIATAVAAVSAIWFACKQTKINNRQANNAIIERYTNHYIKLKSTNARLINFYTDCQNSQIHQRNFSNFDSEHLDIIENEIKILYSESELFNSHCIKKINYKVLENSSMLIQNIYALKNHLTLEPLSMIVINALPKNWYNDTQTNCSNLCEELLDIINNKVNDIYKTEINKLN